MRTVRLLCCALTGCLLVASSPDARADIAAGTYEIAGKSAKRKAYKATITIMPGEQIVYATKRAYGKTQRGIGFKQGNHVLLVFGKDASIALYQGGYAADKYAGVWTKLGAKGLLGTEEAAQHEGEAVYAVSGKDPKGGTYQGTLALDDDSGVAVAHWELGDRKMCGVGTTGLRGAQVLALGVGKKPHLWVYSEEEDGMVTGYVIGKVDRRFGTEDLTPVGPVKQLEQLAASACACKVKACAEAGLATLAALLQPFKGVESGEKVPKNLTRASKKTAKCLLKRGVTQEQLQKALE